MMLYRNTKVKVCSPDGNTAYFDIVAGALQEDPYPFITLGASGGVMVSKLD